MTPRSNEDFLAELIERELQSCDPMQTALTYLDQQHWDVTGTNTASLQRVLTLVHSRRNFIGISSMATAGLLIKPLGVSAAEGGFWQNLSKFFMTFGTSILFSFLTQGTPGSIPGFGGLSGSFLNPLLQLIFAGGCFGNLAKP
ncbi:MAG TPA: hypothetical protein VN844_05110, partial [Pyrinomonadaceae bacterium]|nr:hypothetical protein [Pyrinomonadaceae bacterium]